MQNIKHKIWFRFLSFTYVEHNAVLAITINTKSYYNMIRQYCTHRNSNWDGNRESRRNTHKKHRKVPTTEAESIFRIHFVHRGCACLQSYEIRLPQIIGAAEDLPLQSDSKSCGAFVLAYAYFLDATWALADVRWLWGRGNWSRCTSTRHCQCICSTTWR